MRFITFILSTWLASSSVALPSWPTGNEAAWHGPTHGPEHSWSSHESKAVYFLRVDPAGSSIVAIKVGSDGMLENETSVTSTEGIGQQSQNASTPALAPVSFDPLQGQQAVSIGDDYLFTVNSGSDTAVMFQIDAMNPLELKMVGQPMPTLGQFPMSIAYSSKYKKACVLNGGAVNGVTCFNVDCEKGLVPDGVGLRKFGYAATTPPQLGGPKGSGSDIQFNIDSSKLITTFKGQTKPKMTLGHISVFDVDNDGDVANMSTDSHAPPSGATFGFALNGHDVDQLLVSDAAFGGVLVSIDDQSDEASALAVVNNTNFGASCWATWSADTGNYYIINAATPNFGVVDASGSLMTTIDYSDSLGGGFDAVVDGKLMYFLTAVNDIAVIDLESGGLVQTFQYNTTVDRQYWTGMAMWPASPMLSGGL